MITTLEKVLIKQKIKKYPKLKKAYFNEITCVNNGNKVGGKSFCGFFFYLGTNTAATSDVGPVGRHR